MASRAGRPDLPPQLLQLPVQPVALLGVGVTLIGACLAKIVRSSRRGRTGARVRRS